MKKTWTIEIIDSAPPKPLEGAPCNGCGVCCAYVTCCLARLRFLQEKGACPALLFKNQRYFCGLLLFPHKVFPRWVRRIFWKKIKRHRRKIQQWVAKKIAVQSGCDCSVEVVEK